MTDSRVLWLMGGLGNVLFQLFAKHVIEFTTSDNIKVCNYLLKRNLITRLGGWSIHEPVFESIFNLEKCDGSAFVVAKALLSKQIGRVVLDTKFVSKYGEIGDAKHILGYFQSKDDLIEHSRHIATFSDKFQLPKVSDAGVVMHYRDGDSVWALRNQEFYHHVLNAYSKTKLVKVVTDSPDKAKSFFSSFRNFEIIEGTNPLDDFNLMRSARELIIAPSTFSWWAGLVSKNVEKVYLPQMIDGELGFPRTDVEKIVI